MTVNLICAIDSKGGIGAKGQLLYSIPEDLKRFREITTHNEHGEMNYVVMGRTTFESLPSVLPNRTNVVVTRNEKYKPKYNNENVMVVNNLEKVLNHYHESGVQTKSMFIIGGSEIYAQSIPYVDRIYLTIIHDDSKVPDTYFPMMELINFKVEKVERHHSHKYGIEYSFVDFVRREEFNGE